VRNQVKLKFNGLGMAETEYQAHGAAVVEATDPNVAYRYDATHASGVYTKGMRLNRIEYPNGRFVHYTYAAGVDDDLSRVTSINNDNGSGEAGATVFSSYEYDGGGRIVVEDYATAQVRLDLWGQNAGTYAGLDRFGRIKQQWWRDYEADANVDKFTYGYDRNSNRLWKENVVPGELETPKHLDELYAYDKLNRLTAADRGNLNANKDAVTSTNFRQAWTLDDVGNWTTFQQDDDGTTWDLEHEREHNLANEIEDTDSNNDAIETTTGTDWVDPAHDAAGNMTQVPVPGDETHHYVCTYDAWNRLVKIQTEDETPVTVAEYRYDGLHRRIAKLVYDPGESEWVRTDFYYTRSWQVIEERLADEVATEDKEDVATAPKQQYIWSLRYIDACVLRDEDTDSDGDCTDAGGSERVYYCNGANMEVTSLLEADGDVTERYLYDPYGQVTVLHGASDKDGAVNEWWPDAGGSDHGNEILYCGYRYDPDANMYHVRYRMYHPALGRWLQRDTERYLEGLTLYEYVMGSPLTRLDPLGAESTGSVTPITRSVVKEWIQYDSAQRAQYWKWSRYDKEVFGDAYKEHERYRWNKKQYEKFRDEMRYNQRLLPTLCDKEGATDGTVLESRLSAGNRVDPWTDQQYSRKVAVLSQIVTVANTLQPVNAPGEGITFAVWGIKRVKREVDPWVWVKIQCYVCVEVEEDGKKYLKWKENGDPSPHILDTTDTLVPGNLRWQAGDHQEMKRIIEDAVPEKIDKVCGGSEE